MSNFIVENVKKINSELIENDKYEEFLLKMTYSYHYSEISFLGIEIWNSEDDLELRTIVEDTGTSYIYEDLEVYLRREVNEKLNIIRQLKLED